MTYRTWYKLNEFFNLMQLWHVIISMMSFYFLTVPTIQHTTKSWFQASEGGLAIHVSLRISPGEG